MFFLEGSTLPLDETRTGMTSDVAFFGIRYDPNAGDILGGKL